MVGTKLIIAISGSLMILASVGCARHFLYQGETQLDCNWGRSYETATYHQILNPNAGENLWPVTGLEGRVGERIMEDYVKGPPKKKASRREIGILAIK